MSQPGGPGANVPRARRPNTNFLTTTGQEYSYRPSPRFFAARAKPPKKPEGSDVGHLYASPPFSDFGPCALDVDPSAAQLQRVDGSRSSVLRRGVRAGCPRLPGVYGMVD